ncbi:hypothetical protein BGZ49_004893 [Haplosporangium sp. Z 27]|nr:hypothetical protein BGZ49_004893 [Haplosporangium sp. Z 27]
MNSTATFSRSSSMSISSLLSDDCTPSPSYHSSYSSDTEQDGDDDSDTSSSYSYHDIKVASPTPNDISLITTKGTQASLMLKRINEYPIDLEDIFELLFAKMAILILPICSAAESTIATSSANTTATLTTSPTSTTTTSPQPSSIPDLTRAIFEDHVVTRKDKAGEFYFESLSGIHLKSEASSSSLTILNPTDPQALNSRVPTSNSNPTSSSSTINSRHQESTSINEKTPITKLRLLNASAGPIEIAFPSLGSIYVLLINQTIPAPTVRRDYIPTKRNIGPASATYSPRSLTSPLKKRRRRRVTSEEESRVIPEGYEDDPDVRPRFKCNMCDKTFSRPYNLRSHRATHVGIKPFKCTYVLDNGSECHWEFARKHDLERHMGSRHAFVKPFKCNACGATCGRNDSLRRHYERNQYCASVAAASVDDTTAISSDHMTTKAAVDSVSQDSVTQPQPQFQPRSLGQLESKSNSFPSKFRNELTLVQEEQEQVTKSRAMSETKQEME